MSSSCNHQCGGCSTPCQEADFRVAPHAESHIKRVIGVISGKGGVGKSLVTASLAVLLQRKGLKVGIMDADITGPSIPMAFGLDGQKASGSATGILPMETATGIKVMSVNLLLDNHLDPVVWRGPVIAGVVKQFWSDVLWGELDVLLVDMPPGTGDVPLTVFQSLPVDGAVLVTAPQDLVAEVVEKAMRMAEKMQVPMLGMVENYAWFECPDCHSRHYLFGEGRTLEWASRHRLATVCQMPIQAEFAALTDAGQIESIDQPYLDEMVTAIAQLAKASSN